MAKISINCGNCGNRKGCQIRKTFINFVKENHKGISYTDDLKQFSLKCPFKTSKFKEFDNVKVTIGVGRYSQEYKHECLMNEYHEEAPCDSCKFRNKCNDGEVTHVNTRYTEFIKIDAEIVSSYNNDKFQVLRINYNLIENQLNGRDKVFLRKINEALDHSIDEYLPHNSKLFYIISKNKFIELI